MLEQQARNEQLFQQENDYGIAMPLMRSPPESESASDSKSSCKHCGSRRAEGGQQNRSFLPLKVRNSRKKPNKEETADEPRESSDDEKSLTSYHSRESSKSRCDRKYIEERIKDREILRPVTVH